MLMSVGLGGRRGEGGAGVVGKRCRKGTEEAEDERRRYQEIHPWRKREGMEMAKST